MKELQPFIQNPRCPKCLSGEMKMALWLLHPFTDDTTVYLEVICPRCKHWWHMKTANSGEEASPPKVLGEQVFREKVLKVVNDAIQLGELKIPSQALEE